jgi:ABC-type transport system involved in cytochrome bd biosynthesis fused ATPase/permease subunit
MGVLVIAEIIRRFIQSISDGNSRDIVAIVVFWLVCTALMATLKTLNSRMKFSLAAKLNEKIEDELLRRTIFQAEPFDARQRFAHIGRTANDIANRCIELVLGVSDTAAVLIALTVYIASLDYAIVLICYSVGTISLLCFGRRAGDVAPYSKASNDAINDVLSLALEHISNAETSSFHSSKKTFARMQNGIALAKAALTRFNKKINFARILERSSYFVNLSLYLVFVVFRFEQSGEFDLAVSTVSIMLLPTLSQLLFSIPNYINEHKSVLGLFRTTDVILQSENFDAIYTDELQEMQERQETFASLRVKDLHFEHSSEDSSQTSKISFPDFIFPTSRITFIVGETGAGKSTLLKLLAKKTGGYDGDIFWNSRELRGINQAAMYSQVLFLDSPLTFAGTIEENITLGRAPGDMPKLAEAIHKADLGAYVEKQPDALKHAIKSAELSFGENQKLSIARIFFHAHRHYLLDEIMSAIDMPSQKKILGEFRDLARRRNSVFALVTHALALIDESDWVIFVDKNGLCRANTHDALYNGSGSYRAFFDHEMFAGTGGGGKA